MSICMDSMSPMSSIARVSCCMVWMRMPNMGCMTYIIGMSDRSATNNKSRKGRRNEDMDILHTVCRLGL
jgi:hypothetical protein